MSKMRIFFNVLSEKDLAVSCLSIYLSRRLSKCSKRLLFVRKSSFTNLELRLFLHLPSSRVTTYTMSLLDFPYTGTTKSRVYHPPKDFL